MDEFLKSWNPTGEDVSLTKLMSEFRNWTGAKTLIKVEALKESLALYGLSLERGKIVKIVE